MKFLKRIVDWLRPPPEKSPFTVIKGQRGIQLVDQTMLAYLSSTAPQPTQAALDALMDQVHAVRVFGGGCNGETLLSNNVLQEVYDPDAIKELRGALSIVEGPSGHCMCYGGPTLEMLSKDQVRLALIGIHHGRAIRWSHWKDDARLINGRLLLEWLAEQNIVTPLQQFEEDEEDRRQGERDKKRWSEAMPPTLKPAWSNAIQQYGSSGTIDVQPLRTALKQDTSSDEEHILALLEWFGSGAGPWSGFPSYESAPEELLLGYSTASIIQAMESRQLSHAQTEGAARFFAGWSFSKRRSDELKTLPESLRKVLWDHIHETQDQDKIDRAHRIPK